MGFILISCNPQSSQEENPIGKHSTEEETRQAIKVDSSECISTGCRSYCLQDKICPHDSIRFTASKLMIYVDNELKSGEPKAMECSCGRNYYILGSDSLEVYLFLYGSGAGNVWYRVYKRKDSANFEYMRSFDPPHFGFIKVLDTKHHGVNDFVFDEERGASYTLNYNGENFDTAYIENVPWAEFQKSGLSSYRRDTVDDNGFLFVGSWTNVNSHSKSFYHHYELSTDGLLAGFQKTEGDYRFMGYFPSVPKRGRTSYNDFLTFETVAASDEFGLEKRFHYFKKDRFIGELVPLDIRQKRAIEANQIYMHPQFGFEVFKP